MTGIPAGFEDIFADVFGVGDGGFEVPNGENFNARAREAAKSEQVKIATQKLDLALTLHRAFSTDDGRAALMILVKMTIARPEAADEIAAERDPGHYAIVKAQRAGQNQLVFKIFDLLRFAQTGGEGPPTETGGDT